jgi:amino acid permease
MNPGSLRSSIFALLSTALGAGAFALPNALFYKCGLINGIILLIFTGMITLVSLNILMKCAVKANCLNYPDLAEFAFGKVIYKLFIKRKILE